MVGAYTPAMSIAETLFRLQSLDSDIDAIRRRVFEIDNMLKGTPALAHTRAEAERTHKAAQAAAVAQKLAELEAQELDEKIASEEKRLYAGAIKSPKEMVEVQSEVDQFKRRRGIMDESLLALMEQADTARADEARCRIALQQAESNFASDCAHLKAERAQIIGRLSGQAEQRAAIVASVPKPAVDQYQSIRSKKQNGIAVVSLSNGACGGCGEDVASSTGQQAHSGSAIALCSNCGRILYAR